MEVKDYSLPGCSLNCEHFVRVLLSELIHHFIQLMTELDPKQRKNADSVQMQKQFSFK